MPPVPLTAVLLVSHPILVRVHSITLLLKELDNNRDNKRKEEKKKRRKRRKKKNERGRREKRGS